MCQAIRYCPLPFQVEALVILDRFGMKLDHDSMVTGDQLAVGGSQMMLSSWLVEGTAPTSTPFVVIVVKERAGFTSG